MYVNCYQYNNSVGLPPISKICLPRQTHPGTVYLTSIEMPTAWIYALCNFFHLHFFHYGKDHGVDYLLSLLGQCHVVYDVFRKQMHSYRGICFLSDGLSSLICEEDMLGFHSPYNIHSLPHPLYRFFHVIFNEPCLVKNFIKWYSDLLCLQFIQEKIMGFHMSGWHYP